MRLISFFFILASICCTAGRETPATGNEMQVNPVHSTIADSTDISNNVRNFFAAFDEKDVVKISKLMIPETRIIHHNGIVTNTAGLIEVINETKNWWPRQRHLSEFEFFPGDSLAVLGFLNEVTFSLPENRTVPEAYRETWVYRMTDSGWHPVISHYSKITAEKHSEEVN